jgi:hypothetical protein
MFSKSWGDIEDKINKGGLVNVEMIEAEYIGQKVNSHKYPDLDKYITEYPCIFLASREQWEKKEPFSPIKLKFDDGYSFTVQGVLSFINNNYKKLKKTIVHEQKPTSDSNNPLFKEYEDSCGLRYQSRIHRRK